MLRVHSGQKINFVNGGFETEDSRTIQALQACRIAGVDGKPAITWENAARVDYSDLNKQQLASMASTRGIPYIGVTRDGLIRKLTEYDATHPTQQIERGLDRRDNDAFLASMGWRIPKADVHPPDPDSWPSVGIVIPVYNTPEMLERCLRTLRTTNYKDGIRLVVVDNASKERKTLSHLEGQKNVIRFAQPVGFSEAVNAGIRGLPDCQYHILYNQDVAVIDPEWLNHLIRWMESRPECGICGPKLLYDNGTIENAGIDMGVGDGCAERGRGCKADDPRFNDYRKVATVSGAVYCLRASVERQMGLMDERYLFGCEDLEYGMRMSAQIGAEVWYVPDAVLTHSSHAIQRANRIDQARVRAMHKVSSDVYEREWSRYYNHLAKTRVAFILPNFHSACGGARVVGALARQLSICGVQAEVFVRHLDPDPDSDFPQFPLRLLSDLKEAEIVVATRFDTLKEARAVKADKRYYLVQQIEDVMAHNCNGTPRQALRSYQDTDFEIITIGEHLAARLKQMGRDCSVLDVGFYRDLYPYVEREPGSPFRVLMYGCEGYKGPDQAQIAEAIRKSVVGAKVNSFHRFAKEPKWSDEHYRPQTTRELAAIYAAHDVYVYASESDGFAMTPIEAMACGTPVVLSDFPGKDQYANFGENCLIAPFRDSAGIAACVASLTRSSAAWKHLVAGGLVTADRYDWNKIGAQYARLMLGAHV